MKFPERFQTGVRSKTIPNPAFLHRTESVNTYGNRLHDLDYPVETYEGLCSDYNFRLQTKNYNALRAILQRNDTDFLYVAAARYMGDQHNHRFVACAADGSLLWNKYVGFVAQGGQNHVYVAGMRLKVSSFLNLSANEQDALLSNSKSRIDQVFGADFNWLWLNDGDVLWN